MHIIIVILILWCSWSSGSVMDWQDKVSAGLITLCIFLVGEEFRKAKQPRQYNSYQKPRITAARKTIGRVWDDEISVVGEMDVDAQHSDHVRREIVRPNWGVVILTLVRNKKYRVRFASPLHILRSDMPQTWHDKMYIKDWIEANGIKRDNIEGLDD